MLQAGYDIKVVSERLGHAQTSITMDVYHHVSERQHVEAGDGIGALLLGAGEKPAASSQ
jgi:integrase